MSDDNWIRPDKPSNCAWYLKSKEICTHTVLKSLNMFSYKLFISIFRKFSLVLGVLETPDNLRMFIKNVLISYKYISIQNFSTALLQT
ncbi:hypothetical protein HZS_7954 [Henneguya salminicola]|nr:hypothetical protein HZS_7954 [Henneguya salminicola]